MPQNSFTTIHVLPAFTSGRTCGDTISGSPPMLSQSSSTSTSGRIRSATAAYVSLAARHFARKSIPAEIIELQGSIEVAPSLGLADAIVDITETGETLRANGLGITEKVLEVSARLIVNRVALKLHAERLRRLVTALRAAAAERTGGTC